jgi:hypothetical protein
MQEAFFCLSSAERKENGCPKLIYIYYVTIMAYSMVSQKAQQIKAFERYFNNS